MAKFPLCALSGYNKALGIFYKLFVAGKAMGIIMKYKIKRNLHTDFSVFEENKLPARSYFIPFSSAEKVQKTDYKSERYNSDRVTMLSGEWDFAYYEKLSLVPVIFDTDEVSFDKVITPSTWQRTGYDQIAYINTRYPFPKKPPHIPQDVATGIYRKNVKLSGGERKVISFLGVAGALSLYVNGKYVGYSEGSHNTAEFDISTFVNDGENEIVAVVYKWSNGTYLECQDMFKENGIFRDAFIISQEECYINDFLLRPAKNADGTFDVEKDGYIVTIKEDGTIDETNEGVKLVVDKQISANDIRARILRLPKAITNLLPDDAHKVKVIFNGLSPKELTVAKNRGYLAGVTDLYKESGLIAEDGSYNPCKAIWKFSEDKIDIIIKEH